MNPEQTPINQQAASATPDPQPLAPNGMVTPNGGMVTPPTGGDGMPVLAPVSATQPQFAAAALATSIPSGWNWGAFWLSWIWGIGNKVWWSFLAFIPFVNIVIPFVLGAKGTAAAWEASENKDIAAFKARQHTWAIIGWVYAGLSLLIVIPIMILFVLTTANGVQQAARDQATQSSSESQSFLQ